MYYRPSGLALSTLVQFQGKMFPESFEGEELAIPLTLETWKQQLV